eukprot:scaffold5641_cov220-Skeletonema_menzelii.AAC.2
MTAVTWYAFEDPKTKREYYFEPVSNKTTWTLPTSGTPVKMAGGASPKSIPASPMSPISTAFNILPNSPAGVKIKAEKSQTKADGSSNKRGFGRRGIVVTIGIILCLNTLILGILVKMMYNSSIVDLNPIYDSKVVPSADNGPVEPADVASGEVAGDMTLPEDGVSTHDAHTKHEKTEAAPVSVEEEANTTGSNPEEIDSVEQVVSAKEDYIENEEIVSDSSSSSDNEDYVEEEAIVSDSSSSSDDTISKRLTRDKIFAVITPVVPIMIGYGVARITFALVARVALMLSTPAAPVVVAQTSGPISIIKAFFERLLGGPRPAAIVVKDPTLLEKIANLFAKLLKIK